MRGDLTIWFSPDLAWHGNERAGKTGRPTSYRDSAIQTILTLKVLFSQALRQARGLVVSLVRQLKLITPPCKNAQYWKEKTDWAKCRNNKFTAIKRLGRAIWKRWSGYANAI